MESSASTQNRGCGEGGYEFQACRRLARDHRTRKPGVGSVVGGWCVKSHRVLFK